MLCGLRLARISLPSRSRLAPVTLIFGRVSLASRWPHAYISRPIMVYYSCVRRYKRIQDLCKCMRSWALRRFFWYVLVHTLIWLVRGENWRKQQDARQKDHVPRKGPSFGATPIACSEHMLIPSGLYSMVKSPRIVSHHISPSKTIILSGIFPSSLLPASQQHQYILIKRRHARPKLSSENASQGTLKHQ